MEIGIILISHGKMASEAKKVIEFITQEPSSFFCVDVEDSNQTDLIQENLKNALIEANQGKGILILSDLYGATPSNICLNCLKEGEIELLSGYNIPMLLKLARMKENLCLADLLNYLSEYGKKNIFHPSLSLNTK